jgi:hypothetical protein
MFTYTRRLFVIIILVMFLGGIRVYRIFYELGHRHIVQIHNITHYYKVALKRRPIFTVATGINSP